jgi:ABC-type bacteriocin/lantibiotic exporter with double-glycine peptidase domain
VRRALATLALAAAGCSTVAAPADVRRALSPDAVVLPVPPVPQEEEQGCGLACHVSLLRFHGLELDDAGRRRFPRERLAAEPIAAGELRDYLRGRGLTAVLVHGSLDESWPRGLRGVLRSGLPVIVELATPRSRHYGLVCGFEPERRWILVMDPSFGTGAIPEDEFERLWARADHLMLVAGRDG